MVIPYYCEDYPESPEDFDDAESSPTAPRNDALSPDVGDAADAASRRPTTNPPRNAPSTALPANIANQFYAK